MASLIFQVAGGKEVNLEKEFNFLLSSDAIEQDDKGETSSSGAAAGAVAGPRELAQKLSGSGLPAFAEVGSFVGSEEFGRWFRSANPEDGVPGGMWKKVHIDARSCSFWLNSVGIVYLGLDKFEKI